MKVIRLFVHVFQVLLFIKIRYIVVLTTIIIIVQIIAGAIVIIVVPITAVAIVIILTIYHLVNFAVISYKGQHI